MKKVLIIEDDAIVAGIYRSKFQSLGFKVEVAGDGEKGLAAILTGKPDCVLLDLMLPKLHGVEVIKKVRANPAFKFLPILVFTNAYMGNSVEDSWEAGANSVLTKANNTPRQVADAMKEVMKLANEQEAAATAEGASPAAPPQRYQPHPAPPAYPQAYYPPPGYHPAPPNYPPPSPPQMQSPATQSTADAEAEFQAELLRTFVTTLPDSLAEIRGLLAAFNKTDAQAVRLNTLMELYRRIHSITGNAGIAGLNQISTMGAVLEALVKELHDKPQNITISTTRTMAQAVDFLGELIKHASQPSHTKYPPANVLVVDDEAISRRAVCFALERAGIKPLAVEDPLVAMKMIETNIFDLIILDVVMPGMDGFTLCGRLRATRDHRSTPVIFVTSLSDFANRAKSTLSGGTDLIAKPFLFTELALKALIYLNRARFAIK